MFHFIKYDKISRLDKEETEGIFNGEVHIFERLDGANAQIWIKEGKLCAGSRSRVVLDKEEILDEFRGFSRYVLNHKGIREYLERHPAHTLYGEWLVKHTINYPKDAMNNFYVFDVLDKDAGRFLSYGNYRFRLHFGNTSGMDILYLAPLAKLDNPNIEEITKYMGQSRFEGVKGEGLVLKNYKFENKWGRNLYAKVVRSDFKEVNKIIWDQTSKDDIESWFIAFAVTKARVAKVMEKIRREEEKLTAKDTIKILDTVFHDIIEEEIWTVIKKKKLPTIDFKRLRKLSDATAINYFIELLGCQ